MNLSKAINHSGMGLVWSPSYQLEVKKQDISSLLMFTFKSPDANRANSKAEVSQVESDYREIYYKRERTMMEITGPVLNKCTRMEVKLNGQQIFTKTFSSGLAPSMVEIPDCLDRLSRKERSQRNRLDFQLTYEGGDIVHAQPLYFSLYTHSTRKQNKNNNNKKKKNNNKTNKNKRKKPKSAAKGWTTGDHSYFKVPKRKRPEPMSGHSSPAATPSAFSIWVDGTPALVNGSVEPFVTLGFKPIENAAHLDLNALPFIEPVVRPPEQDGNNNLDSTAPTTTMVSPNFQTVDAGELLPLPVVEEQPMANNALQQQDLLYTNLDAYNWEASTLPTLVEFSLSEPEQQVDYSDAVSVTEQHAQAPQNFPASAAEEEATWLLPELLEQPQYCLDFSLLPFFELGQPEEEGNALTKIRSKPQILLTCDDSMPLQPLLEGTNFSH